jgi:hypothetical protein
MAPRGIVAASTASTFSAGLVLLVIVGAVGLSTQRALWHRRLSRPR